MLSPHAGATTIPEAFEQAARAAQPQLAGQQCGVLAAVTLWLPEQQQDQPLAMLSRWQHHPLAAFINCFSVATYTPEQLNCTTVGMRGRAQCALREAHHKNNRRILFVADELGIASSQNHSIVLPTNASLSLFAHEVAHWLGFVDEYAMSEELADNYCAGRYAHPSLNVVTTASTTLDRDALIDLWMQLPWRFAVPDWRALGQPLDTNEQRWRLGSTDEDVGLYSIATCQQTERYAWRPVNTMTPMQYYDIGQWPDLYLELIARPR
ncbi:hypothetical protein EGC76_00570 [Pseudidiomarina gelatinasegens]|uniref:Uncharacterized protein n=1 Tax=Pseudidiomarina gelatinasegens TaxID=2487740 RepID=A0A443Z743_9GAMM|nr:hypothetical protein EGC76_00570 [Pseudidiomarina gelatinasegens]